jgi:F-type H+-transporting ATPase subunit delta
MASRKVARRYSKALFELTEELKLTDKVVKDFSDLKKTIDNSNELQLFLKTPVISSYRKGEVLGKMFKGKFQDLTFKFIILLTKKERENMLYAIAEDYLNLVDEKRGIVKVKINTASKIQDKDKKAIEDKLSKFMGKTIKASYDIDNAIIGGFVAKVSDTVIDASISRQLELLREQFIKGKFNN